MSRNMLFVLLSLLLSGVLSCKKDDKFQDEQLNPVNISIQSTNGRIAVPAGNNYTKTTDYLNIPVKIVLSAAAPKIFTMDVHVNNDTITHLIEQQQLGDAVLLEEVYYQLPKTAEIRFGIDTFTLPLQISMQAVERYYGKTLALAVGLSDVGKNNTLDASGKVAILLINTAEIIRQEDIHYISFTGAGSVLQQPSGTNHVLGTNEVVLPVSVTLGGVAGGAFTVNVSASPDTAQALIDDGTLSGSVLLKEGDDYSMPSTLTFPANTNTARFNLVVKTEALKRNVQNKPVLALSLSSPTRHLLDAEHSTIVMTMDPSKLIETDITNTNISYKTQYENTSNANETSGKLIDNNINSKFLLFNFSTVWAQLEFATPQTTGAYTMTSANDAPERDPKNWTLEGSDNGTDWTVLDTQTDQSFGSRFLTVKYTFNNQVAFKFYRLNVSAVKNSSLFQLAEWRLLKRP
ncbi:discoidin domain-containing protein [Chitinophaga filiformis]|uniref:discoidin domain-containing protein n=1 Tax=Chitinophaga filiformis TaxID=104663 RepID=UPI001F314FA8|nr:discoidin domain-containing protein [Chitinophaga filiformis]MCF6405632.1 discoidin domain-containing protein [Chitinophaga filiformis]